MRESEVFILITFELITNFSCNLNCYFCFASKKYDSVKLTSNLNSKIVALIKKISDRSNDRDISIKIYGGESLIHKFELISFVDKCNEFHDINWSFNLITNGTLLDDNFCKKILQWRKKCEFGLTISMEGDETLHNKIRHYKHLNKNSFNDILANIDKYRSICNCDKVHIQTVLSPDLLGNIDDYIDHMNKYSDRMIFDLVPMFDKTFELIDMKYVEIQMNKLFQYYINSFKSHNANHIGIFQSQRSLCNLFSQNDKFHCSAGTNMFCILPSGNVVPCSKFYHNNLMIDGIKYYGNIHNDDLDFIIDHMIEYNEVYKTLTKHDLSCIECQKQFNFGCTGQCLAETINSHKYNWVCEYNKIFGILSRVMLKELYTNQQFMDKFKYFQTIKYPKFHEKFIQWLSRGGD